MKHIHKTATTTMASLSLMAMLASPVSAQGLSASDMAFAFGGSAPAPAITQQAARAATPVAAEEVVIASARDMTPIEMQDTEGAWGFNFAGAVAGGFGAGYGYVFGSPSNSTVGGFWTNVAAGGVGGFISPVRGFSTGAAAFTTSFTTSSITQRWSTWGSRW